MGKVFVQLVGEQLDIETIASAINTTTWEILKLSDVYYLSSPELDEMVDNQEIKVKAKTFLENINGAANLLHGNHKNVSFGLIDRIDDAGRKQIYAAVDEILNVRMRASDISFRGTAVKPSPHPSFIEICIDLAAKEKSVGDVLHYFNTINWVNLYKVYEVIIDDLKDAKKKEILSKLVNMKELGIFTQTAQSQAALGDAARHAAKKYTAPLKPMSLEEAHHFIKGLVERWIQNVKSTPSIL